MVSGLPAVRLLPRLGAGEFSILICFLGSIVRFLSRGHLSFDIE
jgi:hypothetical protein